MSNARCADCRYFLQHYTFNDRRIFQVHCGHCTLGRARRKQPDAAACGNFTPSSPQEEAFVSKEYLSKKLLEYLLSLELLPEIENNG